MAILFTILPDKSDTYDGFHFFLANCWLSIYPSTYIRRKGLSLAVQILLDKSKEGAVLLHYMYRAASINKTIKLILVGINMFWAQLRLKPKPLGEG